MGRGHGARKRVLEESTSRSAATLPHEKEVRVEDQRKDRISKALQQVLGQQEVGFRSVEQEQAMHAVLDRQSPLVVVLPTGGGKSLLFTVPAVVEQSGVTVVVMPYQALIDNLVAQIQKSGIKCIEWKHGKVNPASVVVVSANVAGDITSNGNFIAYAGLLLQKGLLQRVVVDECHLVFTSSN
jgi:superfamily II DNA helicase RecQ